MADLADKASTSATPTQETTGPQPPPPKAIDQTTPPRHLALFHIELLDDMDLDPFVRGEGRGTYRSFIFDDIPPS